MPSESATSEPSTDQSLLQGARTGNSNAWAALVQIYGPVVYSWIRRCGIQPADAADVMQETFLAATPAITRFDYERSGATFRGWLWTIARNKLRDRQRICQQEQAIGGSQADRALDRLAVQSLESPDPPSSLDSDRHAIRMRAIEWLRFTIEPRTWQMFWETAVADRDPQQVAEEMGVTRWTVYKSKARVLKRLREELAGLEDG